MKAIAHPLPRTAIALGLACGLASCAPVDRTEARAEAEAMLESLDTSLACFNQRDIRGYAEAPDRNGRYEWVVLDAGSRGDFLLETVGVCPNLQGSRGIALDMRVGARSCTGDIADIIVPSSIPSELDRCAVRVLGRVDEGD